MDYFTVMITLRQRIIKLSPWDKDLFNDFLRDTFDQSLDFEWLRSNQMFSFTYTRKPWAGKVSVDKTQFKLIRIAVRFYGNDRSPVIVYGKVIVINQERWLKLTYKTFWYVQAGIILFLLSLIYFVVRMPPKDLAGWLAVAAFLIIPLASFYWDLRQADKRMLKYIHESRTKVYEAAMETRRHTA